MTHCHVLAVDGEEDFGVTLGELSVSAAGGVAAVTLDGHGPDGRHLVQYIERVM